MENLDKGTTKEKYHWLTARNPNRKDEKSKISNSNNQLVKSKSVKQNYQQGNLYSSGSMSVTKNMFNNAEGHVSHRNSIGGNPEHSNNY